ncbi:MAG: Uma2 family endonuclease [Bacillota bacterium]
MFENGPDDRYPKVREVAPVFTYDDYLRLDDEKRYEVLRGVLTLVPTPVPSHQEVAMRLGEVIRAHVRQFGLGWALAVPLDVVLSRTNVVQPDVLFISKDRMDILTQTNVWGAPDLVVEVLSGSTAKRDREVKRSIYAEHGVKEYWIVDRDRKTLEVFVQDTPHAEPGQPSEPELVPAGVYTGGKVAISRVLPELVIDIDDLFAEFPWKRV